MIPLQPATAGPPPPQWRAPTRRHVDGAARLARLLDAPHRLGMFAGAVMLAAAALWWGAMLALRAAGVAVPWAVSPTTAHAVLMVFGFVPFFFAGFLFTAGPRWLGLPPVAARSLVLPIAAMALGWLSAVVGFHVSAPLAALGLALGAGGFALLTGRFGLLVLQSRATDKDHPKLVFAGCAVAAISLWAAAVAVALEQDALVRAAAHFALWAGIGVVFASVAHRMIPFFTASALPTVQAWRPRVLLGLLVGLIAVQAPLAAGDVLFAAGDVQFAAGDAVTTGGWPAAMQALRAVIELAGGALLLWLALRWGLVQSLAIRLLAMLHMGFFWLGVAFVLGGVSHALMAASGGTLSLGLAPLHAFTMGYLGSTLIAMATRVVCGHSGRTLAADNWAWAMFWALQVGIVARVLSALIPAAATPLTLLAVQFWIAAVGAWALRYGRWLLKPRADGQPG
ncbi:MAG: NnrS family protein [Burkholderiaceae bacterium]|nr:NnrS family protein [Burkholderiaceae bacterium]